MIRLGLEEEVFVVDDEGRPSADGLYALALLLARDPRRFYARTASNAARGRDLRHACVASVEVATGVHADPESLVRELAELRASFSAACPSRIVAAGALPSLPAAPTVVAALQLHFSGFADRERAVRAFLHFAPALLLLTANSPAVGGAFVGLSARALTNPFIGVPGSDHLERFGDVIISRRLGTVELRLFDPCPDIERVAALARACFAVAERADASAYGYDPAAYRALRGAAARVGVEDARVAALVDELRDIVDVDEALFANPPARVTWEAFERRGTDAYGDMDAAYRRGVNFTGPRMPRLARAAVGVLGWYVPRLPFSAYKFLKEHGYL